MDSLSDFDGFSWRRVAMVGRYFWPAISGKVIAMSVFTFVCMALACFSGLDKGSAMSAGFVSIVSFAIVITPVFFTVRPSGELFCSLPALAAEKRTAVFLFSFLIMPALLTLPGSVLAEIVCPGAEQYLLGNNSPFLPANDPDGIFMAAAIISTFAQIAIGLWAAFALRGHGHTARTALAIFGATAINGIIGFIFGFVSASLSDENAEFDDIATDSITHCGPYLLVFWSILLIFALYKASRAISRKQV